MAKKSKLLLALDAQKGRDYDAEKRKKQVKAAERRKRKRDDDEVLEDKENQTSADIIEPDHKAVNGGDDGDGDEFEAFGSDNEEGQTIPQPQEEPDDAPSEPEDDSDVPLSDLEPEDREDIVPHQRMTINNGAALTASRKRISLVSDRAKHPFHYHNSLVSTDKPASELIPEPNDDETRELMFYKIARDATVTARKLLKQEKIPFTRPEDYFAEMVKTDEHMGKVKKKLYDEAASKKAAQEARKLRDAKKFGKQVQMAKEQERAKEKRETLDKIKDLKKKRKGMDTGRVNEGDDLFQDIAVDNTNSAEKSRSDRRADGQSNTKRQKKDSKFGFGGRKRHSKSGTAESSADMRGFSAKRMKGKPSSARRPGKSRRAGART